MGQALAHIGPAMCRLYRNDKNELTQVTGHPGVKPIQYTRFTLPEVRLGNTSATIELLSTLLLVRRLIDDGFYMRSTLDGFYAADGTRFDFLSGVAERNFRRDNFTGARYVQQHPIIVDQLYSWRQIKIVLM